MRYLVPAFVAATLAVAPLVATIAVPAAAHHDEVIVEANGVRVSHAHTEAPSATAHSIHVYMTVENLTEAADTLVSASVSFAAPGRFEANVLGADGVLAVQPVAAVAVAPGQIVSMEPGSLRVVFDDVKRTLEAGDHFQMTLTFDNAGTLEVNVEIEAPGEPEDAAS